MTKTRAYFGIQFGTRCTCLLRPALRRGPIESLGRNLRLPRARAPRVNLPPGMPRPSINDARRAMGCPQVQRANFKIDCGLNVPSQKFLPLSVALTDPEFRRATDPEPCYSHRRRSPPTRMDP